MWLKMVALLDEEAIPFPVHHLQPPPPPSQLPLPGAACQFPLSGSMSSRRESSGSQSKPTCPIRREWAPVSAATVTVPGCLAAHGTGYPSNSTVHAPAVSTAYAPGPATERAGVPTRNYVAQVHSYQNLPARGTNPSQTTLQQVQRDNGSVTPPPTLIRQRAGSKPTRTSRQTVPQSRDAVPQSRDAVPQSRDATPVAANSRSRWGTRQSAPGCPLGVSERSFTGSDERSQDDRRFTHPASKPEIQRHSSPMRLTPQQSREVSTDSPYRRMRGSAREVTAPR